MAGAVERAGPPGQAGLFDLPAGASPAPAVKTAAQTAAPMAALTAALTADWPGQIEALPADWRPTVLRWGASAAGQQLLAFVARRLAAGAVVYPPQPLRALALTPLAEVRVVVLGQDPYHGPGQAEGLAFSVPAGQKLPPSLRNIGVELQRDLGRSLPAQGQLAGWARQGVLLLNTCLTVEQGRPGSHAGQGWESLTDALIEATAGQGRAKAYLLWGAHAQTKAGLVAQAGGGRHLVLQANHPSPLSARRGPVPFIGCGHFGQAATFVARQWPKAPPLDWSA